MANVNDMFPSQWIKASDLNGKKVDLVISHIATEEVGSDHKPVLYFEKAKKGLVLNKTNADAICMLHGAETDAWPGRTITLGPEWTTFQGKHVPCVRVQLGAVPGMSMPDETVPQGPPPIAADTADHMADLDDEIPF